MPRYEVSIETHFCAAHALRHYRGKTEPTHGHNFRVIVKVSARGVDRAGMAIDFLDLKPLIDAEMKRLNYGNLNEDVPEFKAGKLSPSAENIARVIYLRLAKRLSRGVRMESVEVFESPGCSATFKK